MLSRDGRAECTRHWTTVVPRQRDTHCQTKIRKAVGFASNRLKQWGSPQTAFLSVKRETLRREPSFDVTRREPESRHIQRKAMGLAPRSRLPQVQHRSDASLRPQVQHRNNDSLGKLEDSRLYLQASLSQKRAVPARNRIRDPRYRARRVTTVPQETKS